jgi:hypothetical protein
MNPVLQGSALWRVSNPAATKFQFIGGAKRTAILSRKRHTVRAQGIGGARSGRAINKKHARHDFY